VCDIVVKKFTFAISSPDEFLFSDANNSSWGRPFPLKLALKVTHPPFDNNDFDQCRLIVPQP